ncbi:MAG: methyltransferase [Lachnospiraceae bacterium]|nr:methyltransferase [Lachnospiraceae bacterium]
MQITLSDGITFDSELLEKEKWLSYLYYTENKGVNMERVEVVEQVSGKETLCYVFRSLKILESDYKAGKLTEDEYNTVKTVLSWSEVSKGGNVKERESWRQRGYALDIHNLASSEIYKEECNSEKESLCYTLIKTHGLIGQALRGEVLISQNKPLYALAVKVGKESLYRILYVLNHCIIGAVKIELWEEVREQVKNLIGRILDGDFTELDTKDRMRRLDIKLESADDELIELFSEKIFPYYELWYFQAAFGDFATEQIKWILKEVLQKITSEVKYISFKPIADGLYYDYEGRKHLNVYKERIIEKYIKDSSIENVKLSVSKCGRAMLVDFKFSAVCEKLIDFCVEAERCGLLTFEKSITVLYDMFGFRRDAFDRLNNEDKYLATMNASESSTKNTIIDYVTGNRVVDVGSGGGVLLDLLEEKYPDKDIIGTDISDNVIMELEKKKSKEGHKWSVLRHNFVVGPFPFGADSVIFSSILHEVFSYTETKNGRFEIDTVKQALKNAYASLESGGRIIIRDGIKSPMDDSVIEITFTDPSGIDFFKNYVRDFEGLKDIRDKKIVINEKEGKVSACTNFAREFLYTYTWGQESYAHEVQEQFGYFTIDEYRTFFEELGAKIIRCDAFLEPGYVEYLSPKVRLSVDRFPDSNCIVIAEKV